MISQDNNKNNTLKVAIYLRVGNIDQIDCDYCLLQKRKMVYYVENTLKTNEYKIFEDIGYSSLKTYRPDFERMMELIRNDKFSHLAIYNLTRLSNNAIELTKICNELAMHNTTLISVSEAADSSNPLHSIILRNLSSLV